jgi:hypothetical protein
LTAEPLRGPERVDVGARRAVAITLRETPVVRRYLASTSPTGAPVLFILEAPEAVFEAHLATMAGVPGWVAS